MLAIAYANPLSQEQAMKFVFAFNLPSIMELHTRFCQNVTCEDIIFEYLMILFLLLERFFTFLKHLIDFKWTVVCFKQTK